MPKKKSKRKYIPVPELVSEKWFDNKPRKTVACDCPRALPPPDGFASYSEYVEHILENVSPWEKGKDWVWQHAWTFVIVGFLFTWTLIAYIVERNHLL